MPQKGLVLEVAGIVTKQLQTLGRGMQTHCGVLSVPVVHFLLLQEVVGVTATEIQQCAASS